MKLVGVGACYLDTILSVPYYPSEDEKLRATTIAHRRGGNVPNALEVLQQLPKPDHKNDHSLILCSVLPSVSSVGVQEIKKSFGPNVDLSHCLHREQCPEPASSYIIKSCSIDSRTIVNYNDLPEMTLAEFTTVVGNIGKEASWYHFEGRNPDVTLQCMQYLRRAYSNVTISVEIEKPGRIGLEEMAAEADVVFYSKSWAFERGYQDAASCLKAQADVAIRATFLFCTWGEDGSAAFDIKEQELHLQHAFPAVSPGVVDPIGAGDTFIAGILYGLLWHSDDWDMVRKLAFANELASRKVCRKGFGGLGSTMRTFGFNPP
ncbi:pfkB family kinase [Exophiala viscosa]|uniref:pfkB family kinase n=1 Tax=Exophiala viscosa TaxID=2486360 RepID=UPI002198620C|nr:pfkB family kinase [Exophiala viscosa]